MIHFEGSPQYNGHKYESQVYDKISDDTEPICSICNLSYTERVRNVYVLSSCCD